MPARSLMLLVSDLMQAFFNGILELLGVKGAKIEEVYSVDEDSLAQLPYVSSGYTPLLAPSHDFLLTRYFEVLPSTVLSFFTSTLRKIVLRPRR